jgi:energy-coupling factor transporter ATP-binding protein EcfA2
LSLYKAFGLVIESPFELPEASRAGPGAATDITVSLGFVDLSGLDVPESGWWASSPSPDRLLFRSPAGIFEVRGGARITIDPDPGSPPEKLRLFLMGSALGAAQVQRGRIPVHGGAVYLQGGAVVITGRQGAGKSTMTSALVRLGLPYLSDDVCSVELAAEGPLLHPAYPQRKLERGACLTLGHDPAALPVADAERDKFAIRDSANWHGSPALFKMLVELVPVPEAEDPARVNLRAEEINGHARLMLLTRSLYRPHMHMKDGRIPPHEVKKLLTIAAAVRMYRVFVPRNTGNILKYAGELAVLGRG